MVTRILGLQAKPTPADAADVVALVICHCCDDRKSEVSHLQSETHAPHGALS
jgi:Holliday junction resolvasome RuvABC endonuclease subunit